jgi:tetratricopeptide (TPR) repeat protein
LLEQSGENSIYTMKFIALTSKGGIYEEQKQLDKAEEAYDEALQLAQENDNRGLLSLIWFKLGHLYDMQGKSDQALDAYRQRVNAAKKLKATAEVAWTLDLIGELHYRLGALDDAKAALEESLASFEALRVDLNDKNNVSLFDTQMGAYGRLQEVLVALDQPEEALEVAERGRARAYAELLAARQPGEKEAPTLSEIKRIAQTQHATLVLYSLVGSRKPNLRQLLIWVIQPSGTITLCPVEVARGSLGTNVKSDTNGKSGSLVDELREEISKGAAVYQKKCQRCAALQKSGGARLKWRELIARERQRDLRWLTDEEARVLLVYLENPPL